MIETLATIDAQEAAAIAAAEEAALTRDYGTFLDQMEAVSAVEEERKKTLSELQTAMQEENKARQERAEMLKNEVAIVEQFAAGETDPVTIFQNLDGNVPYDVIVEYAKTLPEVYGQPEVVAGVQVTPVAGGGVRVGGVSVPSIGGLTKETATPDDIDALPISEAAKGFVRMWSQGRMTVDEILKSMGTSNASQALKNEVIGVVSQLEEPVSQAPEDKRMQDYMKETASNTITAIDNIFRMMKVTTEDIDNFNLETGEFNPGYTPSEGFGRLWGTEASAMSRALFQVIPGTDANQIDSYLDTVKALIGFDALADMRAASPTGGALGQVTEKELNFLQSVQGSLRIGQQNASLLKTLKEVRDSSSKVMEETEQNTAVIAPAASSLEQRSNAEAWGVPDQTGVSDGIPDVVRKEFEK